MNDRLFLGLDYSTQQLKCLVFDDSGRLVIEEYVDYDSDLKHYGTVNGVIDLGDGVVCSPSAMWIEATDVLFSRLSRTVQLSAIAAISGSAQQHTSIFWANGSSNIISNFDSSKLLIDQVNNMFSRSLSPSWMDTSTSQEYGRFIEYFGGALGIQTKIGSTLAKRFSGLQIMKAFKDDVTLDNRTQAITLVSNGMCSIFVGRFVGVDLSDAAGTGLQKCGECEWNADMCSIISSSLQKKLGDITPSNNVAGYLSDYFVKRYRMDSRCQIVSFTGDNPSSVVAMLLKRNDLCLSLGTSDTLFASSSSKPFFTDNIPKFVFPHPSESNNFISLLCYKNGSQVRERLCKQHCDANWDTFSHLLKASPIGNNGIFGLFYDNEEITPPSSPDRHFYNAFSNEIITESELLPPVIIRALVEGQLLTKYCHSFDMNSLENSDFLTSTSKLLVTGGASSNNAILQVIADVFGLPVYTSNFVNSAALGSVLRAVNATENHVFGEQFTQKAVSLTRTCEPKNHEVYRKISKSFSNFLKTANKAK